MWQIRPPRTTRGCRRKSSTSSRAAARGSSSTDVWRPLQHLYEAGRYDEAADRGRELVEANPEYPLPLYNLACCESLAGRTDDAIEHLRLGIERFDQFRSYAANDSDFDPIRGEPAFKELVG